MRQRQTSFVAGCLLLSAACYTYRPLTAPSPPAGTRVDVELTDEGRRSLASQVGPETEHVEGTVVRADATALDLAVSATENVRGEPTDWNGEQVQVSRQYIEQIHQRRLSVGGTGILGGAVAAGLITAVELFGGRSTAEGAVGGGPGGAGR
jgi:hypothetical protein